MRPWRPVALVPTARFCGEIIFPSTPPEEFSPTVRFGLTPICCAVTFCRFANRAFDEVSEPASDQGRDRQVAYRVVKLLEQDPNLP